MFFFVNSLVCWLVQAGLQDGGLSMFVTFLEKFCSKGFSALVGCLCDTVLAGCAKSSSWKEVKGIINLRKSKSQFHMKEIQVCRRECIERIVEKQHKERQRRLALSKIFSSPIWDSFKVHWWVWENWTIMALIKIAKRDLIVNWMSRQPQILLFIWIFITVVISSMLRAVYSVLVHRVKCATHKITTCMM